jgi:hypothetical protein
MQDRRRTNMARLARQDSEGHSRAGQARPDRTGHNRTDEEQGKARRGRAGQEARQEDMT